jgi:hypothetical protein
MLGRAGDRTGRFLRFLRILGTALYALFLVTAPFEHHDLNCELKTPQHCTACASSQLGADPYTPSVLSSWRLADAGRAVSFVIASDGVLLQVKTTGRSPPPHA